MWVCSHPRATFVCLWLIPSLSAWSPAPKGLVRLIFIGRSLPAGCQCSAMPRCRRFAIGDLIQEGISEREERKAWQAVQVLRLLYGIEQYPGGRNSPHAEMEGGANPPVQVLLVKEASRSTSETFRSHSLPSLILPQPVKISIRRANKWVVRLLPAKSARSAARRCCSKGERTPRLQVLLSKEASRSTSRTSRGHSLGNILPHPVRMSICSGMGADIHRRLLLLQKEAPNYTSKTPRHYLLPTPLLPQPVRVSIRRAGKRMGGERWRDPTLPHETSSSALTSGTPGEPPASKSLPQTTTDLNAQSGQAVTPSAPA